MRSATRFNLGDWDGAAVDAAAARALAEAGAQAWSVPGAESVSVDVPAQRGEWDTALEHLARARAASVNLKVAQIDEFIASHSVVLALAQQQYELVLALVEPLFAQDYFRRHVATRCYRWMFRARIEADVALGRLDDATLRPCH